MYLTVVVMALMAVAAYTFKMPQGATLIVEEGSKGDSDEAPTDNFFEFIKTYPSFMIFLLGVACCFFSHDTNATATASPYRICMKNLFISD